MDGPLLVLDKHLPKKRHSDFRFIGVREASKRRNKEVLCQCTLVLGLKPFTSLQRRRFVTVESSTSNTWRESTGQPVPLHAVAKRKTCFCFPRASKIWPKHPRSRWAHALGPGGPWLNDRVSEQGLCNFSVLGCLARKGEACNRTTSGSSWSDSNKLFQSSS